MATPLVIKDISLSDVPAKDLDGHADPYVSFHIKDQKRKTRRKTPVAENNQNPTFDGELYVYAKDPSKGILVINVYDHDILKDDKICQREHIKIKSLNDGENIIDIDLHKPNKKDEPAGHLHCVIIKGGQAPEYNEKEDFGYDIHIDKAYNLIKMDGNASDPYVKVYLKNFGRDSAVKTKVVKDNCDPVWDQHIFLTTEDRDETLVVELWDDDTKKDDLMMDNIEIPLNGITRDSPYHFDQDIQRKGEPAGHLEFHIFEIDPKDVKKKCKFSWGSYSSSYSTSFSGYSSCSKSLSDILKDGDFNHIHLDVKTKDAEEFKKPKEVHEIKGTIVKCEDLPVVDDENINVYATIQLIGRSSIAKGKHDKVKTDEAHEKSPEFNKDFELKKGKKGDYLNIIVYQNHSSNGVFLLGTAKVPIKDFDDDEKEKDYDLKRPLKYFADNDEHVLEGQIDSYGKIVIKASRSKHEEERVFKTPDDGEAPQ